MRTIIKLLVLLLIIAFSMIVYLYRKLKKTEQTVFTLSKKKDKTSS